MNEIDLKLDLIKQQFSSCQKCLLHKTRKTFVFSKGSGKTDVMIVGEAPGRDEDIKGIPFCGRSGELLHEAISKVFNHGGEDFYITNIAKCRPTIEYKGETDRAPDKAEIESCSSILYAQIDTIRPKLIITLGSTATKFFQFTEQGITKIHGNLFPVVLYPSSENKPRKTANLARILPLFHPSYVLRNGGLNSGVGEVFLKDLRMGREFLTN